MESEKKHKKNEISYRNRAASTYGSQHSPYRNNVEYSSVSKHFKIVCSELILETGAGTGNFTFELVKRGAEVVAVDYSANSLRINKSLCNSHAVVADLCYLPFRSSVFDKAASINVFQHIPTQRARVAGLRETRRVLKKNAQFLITVYNYPIAYTHPILNKFIKVKKQGYRIGMIYYYSFNLLEFKLMLLSIFSTILYIRGISILSDLLGVMYQIGMKKITLSLETFFERTFLSYFLGRYLLAICQK